MANPSDNSSSNPYGTGYDPSVTSGEPPSVPAYLPPTSFVPSTNLGTSSPGITTSGGGGGTGSSSTGGGVFAQPTPAPVAPTNTNTTLQSNTATQPPMDWGAVFNPPWMGQQSQQWLDFMTGPNGVQFQNQLAQQQEDLQKQIQTAAYTGDWAGMQTLQAQLQNVQIALAQNQAQVNDTLAQSNLTGSYHGAPTLQAQQMINAMGLQSADQALQARGQDVSMAQIQAQLAQSPLVAWYTARGLPPPQSAIMQGPAAWTPTQQNWNWSERGGIAPTGWSSVQDQVPLPPGVTPAA